MLNHKKYALGLLVTSLLIIASACSSEESANNSIAEKEEPVQTEEKENKSTQVNAEKNDTVEKKIIEVETTEVEESNKELMKSEITLEEFDEKFVKDAEEEQYPNGKFQLKDGTIAQADYFNYGENELFYYASAIFFDGKLAKIQLETEATQQEVEESLGVKFGDKVLVEENRIGYEITFNETFHESNIKIYPFE